VSQTFACNNMYIGISTEIHRRSTNNKLCNDYANSHITNTNTVLLTRIIRQNKCTYMIEVHMMFIATRFLCNNSLASNMYQLHMISFAISFSVT
jgi:hypothetical protein